MDVGMESQPIQDELAGKVNESLGFHDGAHADEAHESHEESEGKHSDATLAVQKRLKAQKRAHEREVRDLHARIGDLESRMTQPNMNSPTNVNPYNAPQGGVDDTIHRAVSLALQHKELEERKAREAQNMAHVQRKMQDFHQHLDGMGDKYDDFHDVVMHPHAEFTNTMRDYASTLPRKGAGSAGEVLYKLGKNPDELKRIASLHPHDQASELASLSQALISGAEHKAAEAPRPMGQIKSQPVSNSRNVTDRTPVSDIRARMKSGGWK